MSLLDRLKHIRLFRSLVYGIVGIFTYPGLVLFNKLKRMVFINKSNQHNVLLKKK